MFKVIVAKAVVFKAIFCHAHCGILVLVLVLFIVVLCNVALSSKCFKAMVAIHSFIYSSNH